MKFYYILDEENRVIPVSDWNENIQPGDDWKMADIEGKKYDENWIPLYKEVNGEVITRTAEEIQADRVKTDLPEPDEMERLRADVDYLLMLLED